MKAKKIFTVFAIISILLTSGLSHSQIGFSPKIDSLTNFVTTSSIGLLDRRLSGDTTCIIGGLTSTIVSRYWGAVTNQKAAQYIFELFQSYGYTPRYQNNSATSVNVLARKTGTKYPNQYYVICAHYDDMPSGALAPGADDNASGTVGVLEVARILATFNTDYSIVFAAFDEEERGLYGSKAFIDTAYFKGDSIVGGVNLDMISYDGNNDGKCEVVSNTASSDFADEYIAVMNTYVPTLVPIKKVNTTANSDHASFWTRNYKAFMCIEDNTDFTPYYHTVNDKYSTLNLPYFVKTTKTALAGITAFAANYRMSFTHTQIASGNSTGPRSASVVIKSAKGIGKLTNLPRLYYKINSGSFSSLTPNYSNLDTFKYSIPGQPHGSTVSYYFAAQDSMANFVCTYPAGGRGMNPPGTTPPGQFFSYLVDNISNACVGAGATPVDYPFYTYYDDARTDMLYLSSDLLAGGLTTGSITKIAFDVTTASAQVMNGFKVKMQNSSSASISTFTDNGWTTVFDGTYSIAGTGLQTITLTTPFYWDGANNLMIEICFNNSSWSASSSVKSTTAAGRVVHNHEDLATGDGCVLITTPGTGNTTLPNICFTMMVTGGEISGTNVPKKY
ncbi:MAG: M20/M25/M40 family metallo-hydrolase, partial [Ignavibacteriae bacterium]|nr:M20/M25/M40 family metallo-hydrolase [Ignavibacteriota bacterium]